MLLEPQWKNRCGIVYSIHLNLFPKALYWAGEARLADYWLIACFLYIVSGKVHQLHPGPWGQKEKCRGNVGQSNNRCKWSAQKLIQFCELLEKKLFSQKPPNKKRDGSLREENRKPLNVTFNHERDDLMSLL